jgi:putative two-component system response regulator
MSQDKASAPATSAGASVQDVVIFAMASLAETRESQSRNHILRVQHYLKVLAEALKHHPRFAAALTPERVSALYQSAPLNDMGTIGIPDRILLKPASLTVAEFEIMKTHTTLGYEALLHAEKTLGRDIEFLRTAKELTLSHQEKWDGTGYPNGLSGDQIPVSARLMAIADVYDALTNDRVYKAGVSHEKAVQIIFQGRASHFDPDMVDAFIEIQDEFRLIAQCYADSAADMEKKIDYLANAIAEDAGG